MPRITPKTIVNNCLECPFGYFLFSDYICGHPKKFDSGIDDPEGEIPVDCPLENAEGEIGGKK